MATIRLRDASGEREVDWVHLFALMTAGRADIQGHVQRVEGGPWVSAGAWYLDASRIEAPHDSVGQRYVDRHTVDHLDVDSVLAFLGVDPDAADLETPVAWGREHVVQRFEEVPWEPDPGGDIADSIILPDWGAPFALPVVAGIAIPPWRDPSEEGYFILPEHEPVVWRRLAVEQAIPPPPSAAKTRDKRSPRKRGARVRQVEPELAKKVERQPPAKGRRRSPSKAKRLRPAPRTAATESPPVTVTRSWGLFGCLGQVVGLVGLMLVVTLVVDLGLQRAVSSLRHLDLGATVAAHRAAARRDLPPLLATGPEKSLMQVVVAPDLGRPEQVRALGRLLARLQVAQEADTWLAGTAPRLIFLPVVGTREPVDALTVAILALARQRDPWPWLRRRAAAGKALSVAGMEAELAADGLDTDRWRADRNDPDTILRSRTWSTMAAGLGLGDSIAAINGRPIPGDELASDKATDGFIRTAQSDVVRAHAQHGDDSAAVHASLVSRLPQRTAQRWLQWLVRGERVPTRPLPEVVARPSPKPKVALPARVDIQLPKGAATMGSPKASVTALVFIDFHCPYSRRHAESYRRLIKEFGADLRLVIGHFPIKSLHSSAERAATLAIAAQAQGLFWPAHDLLFEHADETWRDAVMVGRLAAVAKDSGMRLRRPRLRTHRRRKAARVVGAHRTLAKKHGVNGTPYTFINGRPLRGAVSYDKLRAMVQAEIADELRPEPEPVESP